MDILIADDHELYRDAISFLINDNNNGYHIHEVCNHQQAFNYISKNSNLNLILYDLNMPGMNGLEAVQLIINNFPQIPIAIISASDNATEMHNIMNIGAKGFIPKSASNTTILAAINVIISGNYFIPDLPNMGMIEKLTNRQLEILHQLKDGNSNKEIARNLGISDTTVKAHLHSIYQVLGVSNRTQAANTI